MSWPSGESIAACGDGSSIVATGAPPASPDFALDGREESEIAGIYVIDAAGEPQRLGDHLANELSLKDC
jgi:hypothetical protein